MAALTRTDEIYYRDRAGDADRLLRQLGYEERRAGLGEAIERERDLWTQLADETKAHLDRAEQVTHGDHPDDEAPGVGLF